MAELAAFSFAGLWLATCLLWRWSAAGRRETESQYQASVAAAEKTRDDYRKQMHVADQVRAEAVKEAERLKLDNVLLSKSNGDLTVENAALNVSLDRTTTKLAEVLKRLHENLHARKESPWRMLVGRLLREFGNG